MPAERDERLYVSDMRDAVDRILRYWEIVETELPPLRDRLAALFPGA